MNLKDLLQSILSKVTFSNMHFGNIVSCIYASFDNYIKEQYKNYRVKKQRKKLEEYREYINRCYTFYKKELDFLNENTSDIISDTQFSDFLFYAKKRWRKQYQDEALYQSLCFDYHIFDEKTMPIYHIVQLWNDYDSQAKEVINLEREHFFKFQSVDPNYLVSVNYIKNILLLALDMIFTDINKSELQTLKNKNELTTQSNDFEINQFYMSVAKFAFYARKQNNLTQQSLSELCGINRSTIAKMETLKQIPSYETLIQFLSFFGARLMICFNKPPTIDEGEFLSKRKSSFDI